MHTSLEPKNLSRRLARAGATKAQIASIVNEEPHAKAVAVALLLCARREHCSEAGQALPLSKVKGKARAGVKSKFEQLFSTYLRATRQERAGFALLMFSQSPRAGEWAERFSKTVTPVIARRTA